MEFTRQDDDSSGHRQFKATEAGVTYRIRQAPDGLCEVWADTTRLASRHTWRGARHTARAHARGLAYIRGLATQ